MSGVQSKVSVGVTSAAGYAATISGLIASVLVTLFPDVPHDELALIASAAWTILAFAWTQIGRYVQARELAKANRSSWGGAGVTSAGLMQNYALRAEAGSMAPSGGTTYTGTTTNVPRPSAAVNWQQRPDVMRDNALDPDPPAAPDKSLADETLDNPDPLNVPTPAQHSHLKG